MKFLVFEGLDGSGKSTLMGALEKHLIENNIKCFRTREPGGTVLGDEIRNLILRKNPDQPDANPTARTELLLYEASRAQHVDLVIRPQLAQKAWVLCDRFSASSVAFQSGGRQISTAQVEWLNDFATNNLVPDLTILLDLSVEESKKRRHGRSSTTGEAEDRIESEAEAFHERVRQSFLAQAEKNPTKWLVLDASLSPQALAAIVINFVNGKSWLKS